MFECMSAMTQSGHCQSLTAYPEFNPARMREDYAQLPAIDLVVSDGYIAQVDGEPRTSKVLPLDVRSKQPSTSTIILLSSNWRTKTVCVVWPVKQISLKANSSCRDRSVIEFPLLSLCVRAEIAARCV